MALQAIDLALHSYYHLMISIPKKASSIVFCKKSSSPRPANGFIMTSAEWLLGYLKKIDGFILMSKIKFNRRQRHPSPLSALHRNITQRTLADRVGSPLGSTPSLVSTGSQTTIMTSDHLISDQFELTIVSIIRYVSDRSGVQKDHCLTIATVCKPILVVTRTCCENHYPLIRLKF